jgi:hypothetical protein
VASHFFVVVSASRHNAWLFSLAARSLLQNHSHPCNNVVCRIKAKTSVIYKHHEMKEYKLIVNFNEVSKQVNLVKIILSWLKSHSFKVIENEAIISESYVLQIFNCSQMSRFCGRQPDIRRLLTRNTSQLIKHCLKKKTLLFNFNLSANSNHISSYSTLYVHLQHKKNHLLSRKNAKVLSKMTHIEYG